MKRTTAGTAAMVVAIVLAVFFATRRESGAQLRRAQSIKPGQLHALPPLESRAVLPTGMTITPMAAPGSFYVPLNPGLADFPDYVAGQPVTTALSPDGKTLLVLTSGYNEMDDATGRRIQKDSNEYVFVFDVSQGTPVKTQTIEMPNTFNGTAWNPTGNEFYVSGGVDDDVHVFAEQNGRWSEAGAPIALGHKKGLGVDVQPMAAGVAVTADGKKLLVANFENDSMSVIDLATRTKTAELDLRPGNGVAGGEFPFWIVTKGNDEAYVSSPRDRQIVVVNIAGEPKVKARIKVPGEPTKMILDRGENYLYATLPTGDKVAVLDTASDELMGDVDTTASQTVFSNPVQLMGSNPNSLALSTDERQLYVTNGGANAVAVIDRIPSAAGRRLPVNGVMGHLLVGSVSGLIPTGWYPSSVSVSADGKMLYVVNTRSVPGPNPDGCRNTTSTAKDSLDECHGQNEYILQLDKGGFETIPTPDPQELSSLTKQVAENDHYVSDAQRAANEKTLAFLRAHIRHVIYIIKENRTYDQVLGDLPEGNGDPKLAVLGKALSPNHHQIAQQFVDLDDFFCSGDVSGEGWNWSTAARGSELVENEIPVNYAHRGLSYDFEGENRNINVGIAGAAARHEDNPQTPSDKDLLPGTNDVDAPDGPGGQAGTGYLWDAALRAHLTLRNYGFFLEGGRYFGKPGTPGIIPVIRDPYKTKTRVAFPDKTALMKVTDPYFRGFDLKLPDYWRFEEWNREFQSYVKSGKMPNLELVRLMRDHTGDFAAAIDGTGTVEAEVSDNDYAVGELLETVAHSRFANSTIVISVEDDAQNGPDHVDAHRSVALIAGAYVKQGAVISAHYTTVNVLRTIEDILGMKPMGINDDVAEPMADVFTTEYSPWTYTAVVPQILCGTQLPVCKTGSGAAAAGAKSAYAKPRHDAAYWAAKTKGMDFTVEDKIDSSKFNLIIWEGLVGKDAPYPSERSGQDLREDRKKLLNQNAARRDR